MSIIHLISPFPLTPEVCFWGLSNFERDLFWCLNWKKFPRGSDKDFQEKTSNKRKSGNPNRQTNGISTHFIHSFSPSLFFFCWRDAIRHSFLSILLVLLLHSICIQLSGHLLGVNWGEGGGGQMRGRRGLADLIRIYGTPMPSRKPASPQKWSTNSNSDHFSYRWEFF